MFSTVLSGRCFEAGVLAAWAVARSAGVGPAHPARGRSRRPPPRISRAQRKEAGEDWPRQLRSARPEPRRDPAAGAGRGARALRPLRPVGVAAPGTRAGRRGSGRRSFRKFRAGGAGRGPFTTRLSGHAAVVDLTEQLTRTVEEEIRLHPDHWFWVHRRWKTRPEVAPASEV